jgi:hypothetical protein
MNSGGSSNETVIYRKIWYIYEETSGGWHVRRRGFLRGGMAFKGAGI